MSDFADWQRRFALCQKVWITFYLENGIEEISDIYESEEAAKCQVEWCIANNLRPPKIRNRRVHTLQLSQERWRRNE